MKGAVRASSGRPRVVKRSRESSLIKRCVEEMVYIMAIAVKKLRALPPKTSAWLEKVAHPNPDVQKIYAYHSSF